MATTKAEREAFLRAAGVSRSTPEERRRLGNQIRLEQAIRKREEQEARRYAVLKIKIDRAKRDARTQLEFRRDPEAFIRKRAEERIAVRKVKEARARLDAATAEIAARRGRLSTPPRRPPSGSSRGRTDRAVGCCER